MKDVMYEKEAEKERQTCILNVTEWMIKPGFE